MRHIEVSASPWACLLLAATLLGLLLLGSGCADVAQLASVLEERGKALETGASKATRLS